MTLVKKIQISILFLLSFDILFCVFLVRPLFLEIKKSSEDLVSLKKNLALLEAEVEVLANLRIPTAI